MDNKNLVNNCVKYIMFAGITFAILKMFPSKNFTNMEIFVIISIVIIGIFSLDCLTSSNREDFKGSINAKLNLTDQIFHNSILLGRDYTENSSNASDTIRIYILLNGTKRYLRHSDLYKDNRFLASPLISKATLFNVKTRPVDNQHYFQMVDPVGGFIRFFGSSLEEKLSNINAIKSVQLNLGRNLLTSYDSPFGKYFVYTTNNEGLLKLGYYDLYKELVTELPVKKPNAQQLQNTIEQLQQQLIAQENKGTSNSQEYAKIEKQLEAANAQLKQKLIEEEQQHKTSKEQLQATIAQLRQKMNDQQHHGVIDSEEYIKMENQLEANIAELNKKLTSQEKEEASNSKVKQQLETNIGNLKQKIGNQEHEDEVNCEHEVTKMKNHLETTIAQLRQEVKNSKNNYHNTEISEKYMKNLINDLESKYIIDKTDISNLAAKVESGTHTVEEMIKKLEILKKKGKSRSPKDRSNDMKYSELPIDFYIPLGEQISSKWDEKDQYTLLNTDKWNIPQKRPPVCVTKGGSQPCDVCPMNSGYPAPLKDFDNSRYVSNIKINKQWVLDQIDDSGN